MGGLDLSIYVQPDSWEIVRKAAEQHQKSQETQEEKQVFDCYFDVLLGMEEIDLEKKLQKEKVLRGTIYAIYADSIDSLNHTNRIPAKPLSDYKITIISTAQDPLPRAITRVFEN